MGNSESQEDFDEFARFEGIDTLGYRVLGVQPNSPASKAGLVSFFDFLVGANGKILLASGEGLEEGEEYDDVDFPALCQEFLNKPLELLVWNIKCQEKRLVTITPSDSWGGAGLLGVTIRLDDYGGADERLIRVLSVEPSSPAAICGLVEHQDYLLGTTADSFDSTATLAQVLQRHVDKVVEVYVYNTDSDVVRVVALMPTYAWGGAGLLGAEVGTGYLHRLPLSSRNTTGSSVERKVRWVGMKPAHPTAEQEAKLELEPQLEMEVESESHQEDMHKTMQQVADHGPSITVQPPKKENTEPEVSQDPSVKESVESVMESVCSAKETERVKETAGEPSATTEHAVPAATDESKPSVQEQAQEISHPQEAVQQTMTMPPPPADAAALFAAPPPDATNSTILPSYATQFMPPPPMSHLSRGKRGEVDLR